MWKLLKGLYKTFSRVDVSGNNFTLVLDIIISVFDFLSYCHYEERLRDLDAAIVRSALRDVTIQ